MISNCNGGYRILRLFYHTVLPIRMISYTFTFGQLTIYPARSRAFIRVLDNGQLADFLLLPNDATA